MRVVGFKVGDRVIVIKGPGKGKRGVVDCIDIHSPRRYFHWFSIRYDSGRVSKGRNMFDWVKRLSSVEEAREILNA